MRWYKTVTRIFLILSVVDFTFGGLAHPRAMLDAHTNWMKMAGDMTRASEKRHKPLYELSGRSAKRSTVEHAHSREYGSADSVTGPKADTPPDSATGEENKFFNEEWDEEAKEDMVFTVAVTVLTGLASQFRDGITGPADPGSTTVNRDLITRASVFQRLNDHRHEQDLVSRSLAGLRDEDVRFLSMLSRRMIDSLD